MESAFHNTFSIFYYIIQWLLNVDMNCVFKFRDLNLNLRFKFFIKKTKSLMHVICLVTNVNVYKESIQSWYAFTDFGLKLHVLGDVLYVCMCVYRAQNCSWWWSSTFRDTSRWRQGSLTAQTHPVQLQHSSPMVPWPSGPVTAPQRLMSVVMNRQGAVRRGVSGDQSRNKKYISISLKGNVMKCSALGTLVSKINK